MKKYRKPTSKRSRRSARRERRFRDDFGTKIHQKSTKIDPESHESAPRKPCRASLVDLGRFGVAFRCSRVDFDRPRGVEAEPWSIWGRFEPSMMRARSCWFVLVRAPANAQTTIGIQIILYYIILYYIILYYIILYYTILYYIILYYISLQYTIR